MPIELGRQVDDELHAVDARRERGDHDLARRRREDLVEGVDDVGLRPGHAAAVDVGAVGEQRQDPGGAQLGQPPQIGRLVIERRVVDLEVAGVDQHALRRVQRHGDAVGDAVGDADELDLERADRHPVAGHDGACSRPEFEPVLVDLVLDQRQREGGAQHRPVDARQHVRHAADVVLVAVGEDQRRHAAAALVEVVERRDDQIDARQIGLREHRAGVDEEGGLPTRHGQHVQAELAQPAQRHDIDRRRCLRVTRHGHRNPSQARTWTRRRGARLLAKARGDPSVIGDTSRRRTRTDVPDGWEPPEDNRRVARNYSTAGPPAAAAQASASAENSTSCSVSGRRIGSMPAARRTAGSIDPVGAAQRLQPVGDRLAPLGEGGADEPADRRWPGDAWRQGPKGQPHQRRTHRRHRPEGARRQGEQLFHVGAERRQQGQDAVVAGADGGRGAGRRLRPGASTWRREPPGGSRPIRAAGTGSARRCCRGGCPRRGSVRPRDAASRRSARPSPGAGSRR